MLTVSTVPLVLCTALVALTLLISGIAKAKDPQSTVTGIQNLGLEKIAPTRAVSLILPWFEIALAAVLLLSPVRLPAVIASGLALILMLFYTVVIARALATGRTAGCNCFGSESNAPVSRYTLVRNIALLLAAAGAHASALRGGTGVVSTLLGLGNSGWTWVFGAALIAVTLEAVRRGDALAQPEPQAEVILPEPVYDENGEEQYVRMPIPHAALYLENGRHTNMRALAKNQARVLVFVSATCAGCVKFLKTMASWQERLPQVALHPVYSSLESLQTSRNAGTLPEGLTPLIDREAGSRANFGNGVPLAVVLGADGLIAGGPVAGKEQVEALLADIEEQFAEAARLAEEERQEQMRQAIAEGTSNTDGDHL